MFQIAADGYKLDGPAKLAKKAITQAKIEGWKTLIYSRKIMRPNSQDLILEAKRKSRTEKSFERNRISQELRES